MNKSKVFFMNARARRFLESSAIKARQLVEKGGFEEAIDPEAAVAIKVHMGEAYNVGYLRPIIVRTIVDKVKELGGKPFVTDTTTLPYHPWSSRTLAIDYLETANRNGFNEASMGCPIVIADGPFGTDDVLVSLDERGSYLRKQFVALAIAEADVLISLAHFKGHPAGGYGGAIKNIGVGCASKRGKMNLHGALAGDKPTAHPERCLGMKCEWWEICEQCCPESAITILEDTIKINLDECVYCFACANLCVNMAGTKAIERFDYLPALGRRIADSALACTLTKKVKKIFYLNFAIDITPVCDCYGWTDTPLVNNLGVFASWDPVALDKACIDEMNRAQGLNNSAAEDFDALSPNKKKLNIVWKKDVEAQIYGAVENGLGTMDYALEEVPLDRSKDYVKRIYPEIPAVKLKLIYKKRHPLKGLDCESFGRCTEGMKEPRHPAK